jgi:hypothetical protein
LKGVFVLFAGGEEQCEGEGGGQEQFQHFHVSDFFDEINLVDRGGRFGRRRVKSWHVVCVFFTKPIDFRG